MSNTTDRTFRVTITLKSGVQLVGECDRFVVNRTVLGELREVKWENLSADWLYLNLQEVAAIESIALREAVPA
jgi:hypothetical protein